VLCCPENEMLRCTNAILVVEDNALIRFLICDLLESAGFVALQAEGAFAAVQILEGRTDVGLVVTDVAMPHRSDGITLVSTIREKWPLVKVVVTIGHATVDQRELPDDARVFIKPFDDKALVEAAEELLQAA